jgi:nitroreductase
MCPALTQTIRDRRTIHHFKIGEVPPTSMIEEAIEQAVWAPNHRLSQPWHFQLIGSESSAQICHLNADIVRADKGEEMAEIKLRRWSEIPGWLSMSFDKSEDPLRSQEDYAACCCVAQNLALILWEQGVGMKWTTGKVTRDEGFYEIIGLNSQSSSVVGLFWFGYPVEIPEATRPPLATFLSRLP